MNRSTRTVLLPLGIAGLLVLLMSDGASAGLFHRRAGACAPRPSACAAPRARCGLLSHLGCGHHRAVHTGMLMNCLQNVNTIGVDAPGPFPVNQPRKFTAYAQYANAFSGLTSASISLVDTAPTAVTWDAATIKSNDGNVMSFTSTPRSNTVGSSGGVIITIGPSSFPYCPTTVN